MILQQILRVKSWIIQQILWFRSSQFKFGRLPKCRDYFYKLTTSCFPQR